MKDFIEKLGGNREAYTAAKFFSGTEVVRGMVWMTVILAAAIGHFQYQFKKINIAISKSSPESDLKSP